MILGVKIMHENITILYCLIYFDLENMCEAPQNNFVECCAMQIIYYNIIIM